MLTRFKVLAWLVATVLIAAATLRPGPLNLGIVASTAGGPPEAQQMAVESLLAAVRPGDTVTLVTRGQPLFKHLEVHPGVQVHFAHAPHLDLAGAVAETGQCLAQAPQPSLPVLLAVLASEADPPLGDQAFRSLPPGSSIRLVGATIRPALAEFLNEGLWKHDLRAAPAGDLALGTDALVREIKKLRSHRPTPFTGVAVGSGLLTALLLWLHCWWLRRRRIEVLLSTTEDDLQLVPLQDGERFEAAPGATLQREGGRVRLIGAFPKEADRERWLAPGDEIEWTPGDEAWPIRVCVLRT